MQKQIPMKLDGLPKSDPDSYQFWCSHVFPPKLSFSCIFEVLVDPIEASLGVFVPLCDLRLPCHTIFS